MAKKGALKGAEEQTKAIALLGRKVSQAEVARQLGVAESTISRFKNKPEVQARIDAVADRLVNEALDDIVARDIQEIHASKKLSEILIDLLKDEAQIVETKDGNPVELFQAKKVGAINNFLERTEKVKTDMKRGIGLLPANTLSPVFNQYDLYGDNAQTALSPKIMQFLQEAQDACKIPDDVDLSLLDD